MARAALSQFVQRAVAEQWFLNTTRPSPAQGYLALFSDEVDQFGHGSEISGGAYTRKPITCGEKGTGLGSLWTVTQDGQATTISNVFPIEFETCSAAWGTVVSLGVFDKPTAGNLICRGTLKIPIPITIPSVDRLTIPARSCVMVIE